MFKFKDHRKLTNIDSGLCSDGAVPIPSKQCVQCLRQSDGSKQYNVCIVLQCNTNVKMCINVILHCNNMGYNFIDAI